MTKDELRKKANELPLLPGVYLMMDKSGQVIYVGKAKKLKNRVSQYFQENAGHNEKTKMMVAHVDRFDTIIVRSEFEALVLENSLIKRHMPRYNILLKDDKGYPFVRLDVKSPYPRFSLTARAADDGARYFGPYGGRRETHLAIEAVCGALRLPTCGRKFPRDIGRERPCLNFHMGKCDGFCRPDGPDGAEYRRRIGDAVSLLDGKLRGVTAALTEEMNAAAETLDFERAASLRDRIRALSVLGKEQRVIAGICADTDVWGAYNGAAKSGCAVLHIENGDLLGRQVTVFPVTAEGDAALLEQVVPQYYLGRSVLPREVLLPAAIEDARENAKRNGLDNVEFFVGKAEEVLPEQYEKNHIKADVIVVDPPRKGCDELCLETIVKMAPEKVVYVSCDSSTLARDVKYLGENGYAVKRVRTVDMFGMSGHVETVALLTKKDITSC